MATPKKKIATQRSAKLKDLKPKKDPKGGYQYEKKDKF